MTMPCFIAEVSSNHNGDLQRCYRFIDTAAGLGCGAVKFQLFKIDELFAPEIIYQREEIQKRKNWELPVSFLPNLAKRCEKCNIKFGCTPFYLDAVRELEPYVDFFKIASYEILWKDLLEACAKTGKPVILSTGMATLHEVEDAVINLERSGCSHITLLHCTSVYPTPPQKCNLAAIDTLRNRFKCKVGWSDHSVSAAVLFRAVHHFGASVVEFHLDLEGEGEEYNVGHCWLPEAIRNVIQTISIGLSADGSGEKKPEVHEMNEREWRADPSDGLRPLLRTRELFRRGL